MLKWIQPATLWPTESTCWTSTVVTGTCLQDTPESLYLASLRLLPINDCVQERIAEINQQLEAANAATAETQSKALQDVNSLKEQLAKERAANRKNTESVAKVRGVP